MIRGLRLWSRRVIVDGWVDVREWESQTLRRKWGWCPGGVHPFSRHGRGNCAGGNGGGSPGDRMRALEAANAEASLRAAARAPRGAAERGFSSISRRGSVRLTGQARASSIIPAF